MPRRKMIEVGRGQSPGARAQAAREAAETLPALRPVVAEPPPPAPPAIAIVLDDNRRLVLGVTAAAFRAAKRRAPHDPIRQVELAAHQTLLAVGQLFLDRLTRWL
jgi:hypothetical protein